jgi:hypothetical protein
VKTAAQLKAKSRELAARSGTPPYVVSRDFLFERFLERASLSECRDSFILKGGMLLASLIGLDLRATKDLDATLKGPDLDYAKVRAIITEIIRVPLDDSTFVRAFQNRDNAPRIRLSGLAYFLRHEF